MTIAEEQDVEGLLRVSAVVADARDVMGPSVRPGVTTAELQFEHTLIVTRGYPLIVTRGAATPGAA